jgi:hypothetical protein
MRTLKQIIKDYKNRKKDFIDLKVINFGIMILLVVILIFLKILPNKLNYKTLPFMINNNFANKTITNLNVINNKNVIQIKFRVENSLNGFHHCKLVNASNSKYLEEETYSCLLPINDNKIGTIILKEQLKEIIILDIFEDGTITPYKIENIDKSTTDDQLSDKLIDFKENQKAVKTLEIDYIKRNKGLIFSQIEKINFEYDIISNTILNLKEELNKVSESEKDEIKLNIIENEKNLKKLKTQYQDYQYYFNLYQSIYGDLHLPK